MNRYRQVDRSGRHQVDFDLIADRRRRRQHLIDENESLSLYSEIEMYRDLKQINLNEFNIDKNLIIQSSNQTPANAGIGIDVILKVKFSSFLPAEMWTPGCHVRPIFFINGFDRPALIQNHVEHIKMKCSNGDNVYMVTVEADIPHDIHEQTKIFYFYKLETYDNDEYSFKIENLLLNENRIRFFFPLSHLVTAKNYKTIELPKYTIDEIDGLLIFDKMSPDLLRRSKANLVERVLPVDLITNETMLSEPDVFRRTLNFFKKSFKSLAQNDQEYACLFDNILGRFFDGIVDQAKQNRAHMTDTTFLSLLTIFYLSLRFRMDKNSLRMREILSLHNNNRLSYLLQLDNFFYSENDNNSLENDLKEYLETIQLEVGFNGLLVLYYLKNNREKLRENLFKLKSDNILRLKIKEPMTNLIGIVCNFANHYGCLIQNDSIIGALLLNYFQPGLKDLNELLIRNVLPFDSYIYFVGFKVINDRHDEFKRTLSNKNIPEYFRHLKDYFEKNEQHSVEKDSFRLIKIYRSCQSLLNALINSYSKEFQIILNVVDLIERVYQMLLYFNIDSERNQELNLILAQHEPLTKTNLKRWFDLEFDQNLLISFGVEKISDDELASNEELIRIYNNFQAYNANPNAFRIPNRFLNNKFEDVQEVKRHIRYFGLGNQHEIYAKLTELKTLSNLAISLFKQQINNKLSNNLSECIRFLVRFNFSKLNQFGEVCQKLIGDYLALNKSEHDIENLCTTLQDPRYQMYLDHFMSVFISAIWPKDSKQLEFAVEKPHFLKLITIYVSHKARKLSDPLHNPEILTLFANLTESYKHMINNLIHSNISLDLIKLINLNLNRVNGLNKIIVNNFGENFDLNANNLDYFRFLVQIRVNEKSLFETYRKNLNKFIKFCSLFDATVPKIQTIKQQLNQLDELSENQIILSQVVEPIKFNENIKNNPIPKVVFFKNIDPYFMPLIERLINLDRKNCVIFDHIFKEYSLNIDLTGADLRESIQKLSQLTFDKLKEIICEVESGLIKLVDLDRLSLQVYESKSEKLIKEIEYFNKYFEIKNQDLRNKQILLYVQFKNSYLAAVEIDQIRLRLGLQNEFNELDATLSITKDSYSEWNLLKMNSTIERTIDVLTRINEPLKLKCLTAFTESLGLVEWLRKNAGSLPELKFLVDLASMSSSNDTSYDRTLFAKCLKEAGNAYASLIYGLNPSVNFFEFMNLCETVCSHLDSDKNIAAKLLEVKDKVELLEEIKRMKGNVELNSVKQAKSINESGTYIIGYQAELIEQKFLVNFEKKISLSDIIEVQCENKTISFQDLKELQNILMLIAPRKAGSIDDEETETLEYFIQFFSGVIQLAESYLNLKQHSCMFFDNFLIKINSNFLKKSNVKSIEIINKTGAITYTHPDQNSLNTLVKICALINETEEEWSNFVSKKRDAYPTLNFFTLKQLNFLTKAIELIKEDKLCRKSDFEMVQSILWNLNQDLTKEKMKICYENSLDFMADLETLDDISNSQGLELLFKQQWQFFLSEQNSVNSKYLTLTQLALILQELNQSSLNKDRILPGYLSHSNEPNLIICPNNESISVILSIYALTPDQPLPTNDEILFCQSETTSEEVENFLRLCFNSAKGKIYTLVNIHNLTYTVANKTEKFIKNFIQKSKNFNLIFTCDTGKESESILASVYLKNRVRYVLLEENILKFYINKNLFNQKHALFIHGNFDMDNSSVRIITSRKSGNGKSTYVKYLTRRVQERYPGPFNYNIIRIKSNSINLDEEIEKILNYKKQLDDEDKLENPTIYHIDIAFEVFKNVDCYLFSLALSSFMKHSNGFIWRREPRKDYFLIEITPPLFKNNRCVHSMVDLMPKIELLTPNRYLYILKNEADLKIENNLNHPDRLFTNIHKKLEFQRVCFYLKLMDVYRSKTERFNTSEDTSFIAKTVVRDQEVENAVTRIFNPEKDANIAELECLEILLKVFHPIEPSWHEIRNYVRFLDSQLNLYEKSTSLDRITGFRVVCLSLILIVASNFGLPSLKCNELESSELNLDSYVLHEDRRWENLIHPFMILDSKGEKITFIGTHLDRPTKRFINPNTKQPLTSLGKYFIPKVPHQMIIDLLNQRFPIFDDFNDLIRDKKFTALNNIMNLDINDFDDDYDVDSRYELALDNCLKMAAIYLRFVCNIPVIIMGETGCGKTSLIQFFSKLHKRRFDKILFHMKIHGGTTALDIEKYLRDAEELSKHNYNLISNNTTITTNPNNLITTILFFDEANTTEEIGLIKEIMCDRTCHGRPIDLSHGLKIIAAVNPYRKHSDEMIEKLESAGLGFYISASDTKDKIGHIPMRQLVYRVQPLPTSLMPLVWDFGQLADVVEKVYISQLVAELLPSNQKYNLEKMPDFKLIVNLLEQSQKFMRDSRDECSFVSIRDIERLIKVTKWFISLQNLLFPRMYAKKFDHLIDYSYEDKLTPLRKSFVLGLLVCYHSALYNNETRRRYRQMIMQTFASLDNEEEKIITNFDWVFIELLKCQNVFFDEIDLNKKNIACNLALLENVFMMIICIELRIPLFIVGKPGSSKSLAKTIVSRAMEGRNSKSELFQNLKETYFVNFQCSPLTTSEMILQAFKEAAKFQESADTNRSVAVVNLDEIGLAEGSESMPLKVLHPLLESGIDLHDSQAPNVQNQVAVIGISNWALDPAKMNRGLFVSRGEPDINELIQTAKGICCYDKAVLACIEPYIEKIAQGYLELCQLARDFKREFFGLRDYYSLIKMIFYFCTRDQVLTWSKLEHAIRRNFGGLEIDCLEPFRKLLYPLLGNKNSENDPKCDPLSLVESALKEEYVESNSRYLLFLTENNTAIDIVNNYLTQTVGVLPTNLSVIFGSSFRLDQAYTEVCRNISLIKHSMEIGKTIILLNSYNLYESLYDALNQYYYEFAGQKYVDLGLGTHRIKCSVHDNFRLVIIADKEAVYDSKKFPIPLINRLEKHFLNASTILNDQQKKLVEEINKWVKEIKLDFVGYHSDAIAGIILYLSKYNLSEEESVLRSKKILIQCATADSVVRRKDEFLWNEYFNVQKHLSLKDLLNYHLYALPQDEKANLIQITSHCKSTILNLDLNLLQNDLTIDYIDVCLLQSFDTQHQFVTKLKQFYSNVSDKSVLLVQADLSSANWDLIACARHHISEIYKSYNNLKKNFYVILVILMEKEVKNFVGFQLNEWSCYHLDEIDEASDDLPDLESLKTKFLSDILEEALENDLDTEEKMEISNQKYFSISSLLKKLAHSACSHIIDTNITRTISRIELLIKLCENKPFVLILAKRLINLQREKEKNSYIKNSNWLSEISMRRDMTEFSTLRKFCQSYLESKLSPLLGFVLSKIDLYSNLDTLLISLEESLDWRTGLWLKIFENESLLKIEYSEMKPVDETSYVTELNSFKCQSDFIKKDISERTDSNLRPSLPFFWLLINQLKNLHSNLQVSSDLQAQIELIPRFFQLNPLYQLLDDLSQVFNDKSDFVKQILEFYIKDFLLINLEIPNGPCLIILEKGFLLYLINNNGINLKTGLAMVHCLFDSVKVKFELFCKFLNFEPKLGKDSRFLNYKTKEEFLNVDLHVAFLAIETFKNDFSLKENMDSVDRVYDLIQIIAEFLNKQLNFNDNLELIYQQYESLMVLRYFSDIIRKFTNDFQDLRDHNPKLLFKCLQIFDILCKKLNNFYFRENINFKQKNSIQNLHDFIIESSCLFNDSIRGHFDKWDIVLDKIDDYLNTFYIDVIENLCFETKTSKRPDNECIGEILKVLTNKVLTSNKFSQDFEIKFNYRSLIIQIIFKNYDDNVKSHLTSWFQNDSFIGQQQGDLFRSAEEISILFQNCVVYQCINEFIDYTIDKELKEANKLSIYILNEKNLIKRIMLEMKMRFKTFDVGNLLLLAKFKFCVNILVKYVHNSDVFESVKDNLDFVEFNQNMKSIIEFTYLSSNFKTMTLINYLIKDLIRKYGSSSIKYVFNNPVINWIAPQELIGDDSSTTDRYVLLGDEYDAVKDAIQKSFSVKNFSPLIQVINEDKKSDFLPYICLALYQNVTLLFKNLDTLTSNISDIFKPLIDSMYPDETNVIYPLLQNRFSNKFQVNAENWKDIDLVLILVQLKYSILYSKSNLIAPLKNLITKPEEIIDLFVPTMPQDNLYDIKLALQSGRSGTNRFYSCPNGHIYVIGDCGRPWIKDKCKTCGEEIGGESHKLVGTNQLIDENIHDRTLKGYCVQGPTEKTENIRLLNSTGYYYERFIINACMYLALGDNEENSQHVYKGLSHDEKDLKNFFLNQMKNDLKLLANEMNLNTDEVFILLHLSLKRFLDKHQSKNFDFTSKDKRQEWEDLFYKQYFNDLVEHSNQRICESNQMIQEKNQKFSNSEENQSKLYFMAYELLNVDPSKLSYLYENESFWKYRPNISFDLMVKEFQKSSENKQKFSILNKFNETSNQLKLLPNLSKMIKLINFFKMKYNRTIFKDKARNMSIENFLNSISLPKEFSFDHINSCILAFQNTWVYIQPKIDEYIRRNIPNSSNSSVSHTHKFDMDTKLSYFLPALNSDGLLSYTLIHYLSKIQNILLDQASKKVKNVPIKPSYLFNDLNFLITFDTNSDLLRIIQSNFSYDSNNLKFIFRYESIENQIVDKYLRSKPKIDLYSIPVFEYSDEITNFNIFKRLNEQIKQQSLKLVEQAEIMDQFTNISELSEALNTLKVIINYAISTSAESEEPLVDFLKKLYSNNLYKQSEMSLKTKIMEYCRLKHLKVVWILLMTKRSILYSIYGQDPFEMLNSSFKYDLEMELDLNFDKSYLISLSVLIYQVITFVLSSLEGENLQSYNQITIRDMFESLESLDSIILLENYKIPENFMNELPIKMDCIYALWKQLSLQCKN